MGFDAVCKRFDDERELAGPTAWNAFNAYTGYVQHDRGSRLKDQAKVAEQKESSNLFGANANRTSAALTTALAI